MRHQSDALHPVVVVADDDPDMRHFVSHVLHDAGYSVREAMDVPEALGCLRLPGVAAAVVDMLFVNSNGHSGLDVLRYMRTHPQLEQVPAIILTGFPLNRTVTAEIEALRGELWHKPVDPFDLLRRLHDLVYRRSV